LSQNDSIVTSKINSDRNFSSTEKAPLETDRI
jgi:hypothetical protein